MNKYNAVVQLYSILDVLPYEKQYCCPCPSLELFSGLPLWRNTQRNLISMCDLMYTMLCFLESIYQSLGHMYIALYSHT